MVTGGTQSILVLGGTGFIGKKVMEILKQRPDVETRSVSRKEGLDLLDLEAFETYLRAYQPQVIINCAAHVGGVRYVSQYTADVIHENMRLLLNLYRAVHQIVPRAKIINPVSNCSYPGDADIHYEPDWQSGPVHDSVLAYASTRRMLYALAQCYHKQYGIKSINWLVGSAYGPGDYTDPQKVHVLNGIVIRLIQAQRAGSKQFEIWGTGAPVRELVYIDDVAKILTESLKQDEQIYPVNLAQNKGYSIAEIAQLAAKILNYPVEFCFNTNLPDGALIKVLDDRQFRERCPDFTFTPLETGIRNTINYYKTVL